MALAFEEQLHLVLKAEAIEAKQTEVMRAMVLAGPQMLAAGEITPADPEWRSLAPRMEAQGLQLLGAAAETLETSTRMAARFAATPGGEALAEAHRRRAVGAAAMCARAKEYVAFVRAAMAEFDSESNSPARPNAVRKLRPRRPNARYFGPEWSN